MNKGVALSLALILGAGSLMGGYWLGVHQSHDGTTMVSAETGHTDTAGAADSTDSRERKILYYRNPMGLPDTSPVPKKDEMGMPYLPVYEDDAPSSEGAVSVSPARLQTLGVKTAKAEMLSLDAAIRSVGKVEINERMIYDVSPRFEGWIEKLYINATGDPVKKGQTLFTVYSPELVSARKELAIAKQLQQTIQHADQEAQQAAERLVEAAKERLKNWQVTSNRSNHISFAAPASGIVLEKNAAQGMRFTPGTTIYRIADLSTVWVIADVYEQDLDKVKLGELAQVVIDAYPDKVFSAKVEYVYPTLNANTRTTPVRLQLSNQSGKLRPGMFAHVELATAGSIPRLTVPKSAVIDSGAEQIVFLVKGEGKFKPQAVKLGLRDRHLVEILDGLQDGDEVVVAANFMIDAESNLKAALASFSEPKASMPSFDAMGHLESVDLEEKSVSMVHDPIPELSWPEMSMDFDLKHTDLVSDIDIGQRINFKFEDHGEGTYVITEMTKTQTYQAIGSLESIDLDDHTVSMTHDPIPALQWPEMTMDFNIASPAVTEGILPGEKISFIFEDHGDGEYVITRIEKISDKMKHKGH